MFLLIKAKKCEEMWSKIIDFTRSITKDSDDLDEKYMKIKFDWDDDLPVNKMIEIHDVTIVVRAVFHEDKKSYPQAFLDECLYKI